MNALAHITETFKENERRFPDIMEPYSARLADATTDEDRLSIMRIGLRETIRKRYPLDSE